MLVATPFGRRTVANLFISWKKNARAVPRGQTRELCSDSRSHVDHFTMQPRDRDAWDTAALASASTCCTHPQTRPRRGTRSSAVDVADCSLQSSNLCRPLHPKAISRSSSSGPYDRSSRAQSRPVRRQVLPLCRRLSREHMHLTDEQGPTHEFTGEQQLEVSYAQARRRRS
jgi:hypothetical protein